jgi:hypothetical protein
MPGVTSTPHTIGQTWGALKKSWKAYKIAKAKSEKENMIEYAKRIRTLQQELGVAQSKFPELDLV